MKTSFLIITKILLFPVVISGLYFYLNYDRIHIDGLKAEIYCLTHGEDTRYSNEFSHNKFRQIEIGMTEKEVLDILGKPLTRFSYAEHFDKNTFEQGHLVGLKYSESPNSENYHLRIIHLDYGKVVRIMGELWYD